MIDWRWPQRPLEAAGGLAVGETAVWAAALDLPEEQVRSYQRLLAPDEAARAARFHFERDRRRYVVARGVLRCLLGRYVGLDARTITMRNGPQGKPALVDDTLSFNVSHSGGVGLFAFCGDTAVGIDVEQIRPMPDALALAERFFAAEERDWLRRTPLEERDALFFRIWTCKEAFIKALGEGLSHPLDTFSVAAEAPARFARMAGDDPRAWSLTTLHPAAGYTGALAIRAATAVTRAATAVTRAVLSHIP